MDAATGKKILIGGVIAAGLGGVGGLVGVVKLGEYTFVQHVVRIAKTPEVRELGAGVLHEVGLVHSRMKTQIKAQLAASKRPAEETEAEEP